MGNAETDLVLTAPAWRRWLLLIALFALGVAYIAAYAVFVARSRNFIDVQRNRRARTFAQAPTPVALPAHLTFGESQPGAGALWRRLVQPAKPGGVWSASADTWIYLALLAKADSDLELQLEGDGVRHRGIIRESACPSTSTMPRSARGSAGRPMPWTR